MVHSCVLTLCVTNILLDEKGAFEWIYKFELGLQKGSLLLSKVQ